MRVRLDRSHPEAIFGGILKVDCEAVFHIGQALGPDQRQGGILCLQAFRRFGGLYWPCGDGVARVRAGAEVVASPRLDILVNLIYGEVN
jgi:hypothetical protein